ncbi:MAG TPA: pyridoxamine 5'-phosphate oxidase family protein [Pseudonocardiaceae bacterium]|nr:pyridoxamine 5'-phosphate oxidase family protein [Pseudonocardiaceae bacterium]
MDVRNLADLYELSPVDWAAVEARLDRGLTLAPDSGGEGRQACWLTTINPDGSPHVNGIGALWVDGTFCFVTGERSRKGRNLARGPRCAMSVSMDESDLVVEGTAEQVTDPTAVATIGPGGATGWHF